MPFALPINKTGKHIQAKSPLPEKVRGFFIALKKAYCIKALKMPCIQKTAENVLPYMAHHKNAMYALYCAL